MKKMVITIWLFVIISLMLTDCFFSIKIYASSSEIYSSTQIMPCEYDKEGYIVLFEVSSSWNEGHVASIQISNIGPEDIENWYLEFDYNNNIEQIWNANIIMHEGSHYIIKNDQWNQDIPKNGKASFGISSKECFLDYPYNVKLVPLEDDEVTKDCFIEFELTNSWEEGYLGNISVYNNTNNPIEDWTIIFNCDDEIISIWNGEFKEKIGNRYSIGDLRYNSYILPGEKIEIGMVFSRKEENGFPKDFILNHKMIESINMEDDYDRDLLQNIGVAYCKKPMESEIIYDWETGFCYIKNQILISAYPGTPYEAIEDLVSNIGGEIVGYIEATYDYQVEFNREMTAEQLEQINKILKNYPFISNASLNFAYEIGLDEEYPNDEFYNDNKISVIKEYDGNFDGKYTSDCPEDYTFITMESRTYDVDKWDEKRPAGDNNGLEMMHAKSAWDSIENDTHPVKVGILDNYFCDIIDPVTGKKELEFEDICLNMTFDKTDRTGSMSHGIAVSGVLGAKHNNETGISGMATNVKLYGYSFYENLVPGDKYYSSIIQEKIAFATLICNHIKIINMSLGYGDSTLVYGASHGNAKAKQTIDEAADIMTEYLLKLIRMGYDFLIVKSAGNYNDKYFVKDINSIYGYSKYSDAKDKTEFENNGVEAEYGHYINHISNSDVKDRIIVVGSFYGSSTFSESAFSARGDRIDVLAPGEKILTTFPTEYDYSGNDLACIGYNVMDGTSIAAPFISGLASLIYEIKPSISSKKVKEIICSEVNVNTEAPNLDPKTKKIKLNIPDAKKCVEKAKKILDTTSFDIDIPSGFVYGGVFDEKGKVVNNVIIQAIKHDSGENNIDANISFSTEEKGDFTQVLRQGVYDILVYANDTKSKYIPVIVKNVIINPDEGNHLGKIVLQNYKSEICTIKGEVIDSINGKKLKDVCIKFRKGWNNNSGEYFIGLLQNEKVFTSEEGVFSTILPVGNYTAELVKEGYVIGYFNVLSTANKDEENNELLTLSMVPVIEEDDYRIVLTWGDSPEDLDSHLLYYKDGEQVFHVSYENKKGYVNGKLVATLDFDVTDEYGPETVTITVNPSLLTEGDFHYCVHNYSGGREKLSESNATVRVYRGNELVKIYRVTQNKSGLVWHVFNISASNELQFQYEFNDSIY